MQGIAHAQSARHGVGLGLSASKARPAVTPDAMALNYRNKMTVEFLFFKTVFMTCQKVSRSIIHLNAKSFIFLKFLGVFSVYPHSSATKSLS